MVKKSAKIHLTQRFLSHFHCKTVSVFAELLHEKQQIMGCRKFGSIPEAAVFFIKAFSVCSDCARNKAPVIPSIRPVNRADGRHYHVSRMQQRTAVIFPFIMYHRQKLLKSHRSEACGSWKVCPGKKGLLFGRHEYAGGPTAAAGKGLAHGHIHSVDIRALLPVHLDRNIVFIQNISNFQIFKALLRHYMTPVAGAVSYA